MIKVGEALEIVLSNSQERKLQTIGLLDALGMVLGEDVRSAEDLPSFDRSGMDGFAVRSKDLVMASPDSPVRLKIIAMVAAGDVCNARVGRGETVRITTGAPIPTGTDAVVRQEDATVLPGPAQPHGVGLEILILKPAQPGTNIGRVGEDVRVNSLVLSKGTLIRPQEIGLLAALGKKEIPVISRPRVGIISTGNELVPVDSEPGPGQIRNSNAYALGAYVRECGGVPVFRGIVPDRVPDIVAKLARANADDLVLTTGGASVGEYDVMKETLEEVGARILFSRVRMKPGTPFMAARLGKALVLCLSGNPAAAMTSFEVFVRPCLAGMTGRQLARPEVDAILDNDLDKTSAVRRYLRARLYRQDGQLRADIDVSQRSGILSSMVAANGFVIIPEDSGPVRAGETVKAMPITPFEFF